MSLLFILIWKTPQKSLRNVNEIRRDNRPGRTQKYKSWNVTAGYLYRLEIVFLSSEGEAALIQGVYTCNHL